MPFIHVYTSTKIQEAEKEKLMKSFGKEISTLEGKSEQWLMVKISDDQKMCFQGNSKEPWGILEVSVYGSATPEEYEKLTEKLTATVAESTGIPKDRIYVKYAETPYWGWNGSNF